MIIILDLHFSDRSSNIQGDPQEYNAMIFFKLNFLFITDPNENIYNSIFGGSGSTSDVKLRKQ